MFYELAMRRLEIKVLYEEEEIEVLYSKLNAYRVFIHRNSLLDKYITEINNNFLNVIYKLINIIPKDEKQINHLTKIIEQKKIYHGFQSNIKVTSNKSLFKKGKIFKVGRYHSLKLKEPFKTNNFEITMRCLESNVAMSFENVLRVSASMS